MIIPSVYIALAVYGRPSNRWALLWSYLVRR
jgi:hypothetical protein